MQNLHRITKERDAPDRGEKHSTSLPFPNTPITSRHNPYPEIPKIQEIPPTTSPASFRPYPPVSAPDSRMGHGMPEIYTISPKGIVVIGKTSELNSLDKRTSFERFRQELRSPEIITYDELFERAKFIVGGYVPRTDEPDDESPF